MKRPLLQSISLEEYTAQPLSLYQFNSLIRDVLTEGFPGSYWIMAEISKVTDRGHCYLELVDKEGTTTSAQARGTIWSGKYRRIAQAFQAHTGHALRPGLKILFNASVQYHELYGLSLDINDIDPNYTVGELARQRQEILARLEKEGLLFRNGGLSLPAVTQRIAVVSSPTAAGYGDFMHQLEHNPHRYHFHCTLFPAIVQGNDAPASVVQALQKISRQATAFDLVVILRGGGSQIDLSCFDNYDIAATIARMPLPVLTGIGHERDETITDLVAHTRLKTPTAVAAFLIETSRAFEESLDQLWQEISAATAHRLTAAQERLDRQSLLLDHLVSQTLNRHQELLNRYQHALQRQAERQTERQRNGLRQLAEKLKYRVQYRLQKEQGQLELHELKTTLLDPAALFRRGLTRTYYNGQLLRSTTELKEGDVIETQLADGRVQSLVVTFRPEPPRPAE